MLSLSQTTGYAILALSCLRRCPPEWMMARDISARTGIPLPYLQKLLNNLVQAGIVRAKRGYRGGFSLSSPADRITLLRITEAIEGQAWLPVCMWGMNECSDHHRCPTHDFWQRQRTRIHRQLARLTLHDAIDIQQLQSKNSPGQSDPVAADRQRRKRPPRAANNQRKRPLLISNVSDGKR